jgi:hypothetical protein
MLKSMRRFQMLTVCVALLVGLCVANALPQTPANFSGSYVLNPDIAKLRGTSVSLRIEQTAKTVEITREEAGKKTVSTYPIDGSDGVYTTATGLVGKGHIAIKGNDLVIDTFVTANADGEKIRFHTHETWSLGLAGKILTVHVDTDSPDIPAAELATVIHPFDLIFDRQE